MWSLPTTVLVTSDVVFYYLSVYSVYQTLVTCLQKATQNCDPMNFPPHIPILVKIVSSVVDFACVEEFES